MSITNGDILFTISLLFAIWFALTGIIWIYWGALYIAYPFGLTSFFLFQWGRKIDVKQNRYRLIKKVLTLGLIVSLVVLICILLFDQ